MRRRIFAVSSALFFAATVTMSAMAAEVVDRIVAVVNDDIILMSELNSLSDPFVKRATASVTNRAARAEAEIQVRKQVLDRMVSDALVEQEAKSLGIVVTDREVDADVEAIKKRNGIDQDELLQQLARQGMTLDRLREDLRSQRKKLKLIEFKVKPRVSVGEDQIRDYYDQNFESDAEVTVRLIMYSVPPAASDAEIDAIKDKAKQARAKIQKGDATFADIAKAESEGPGAAEGGLLGTFRRGEMIPAFEAVVFGLDEGEISDPVVIDTDRGKTVNLFLLSKREQKAARSYEEERDRIYNMLFSQAAEKEYARWVEELRDKGFVDIRFDKPLAK